MNALPEWFSPPEDIVNKSVIHREYPFIVAFDGSKAVGFAVLKIHNEYTADVYNFGVLKEYHRMGIGHQLMDACVEFCKENNYKFLTVSTNKSISALLRCSVTQKSNISSAMRTPPRMPFSKSAACIFLGHTVVLTANSFKKGLS